MDADEHYDRSAWSIKKELRDFQREYPTEYRILISSLYQGLKESNTVCALLKPVSNDNPV